MFSGSPEDLLSMTKKVNGPGLWWPPWRVGLFVLLKCLNHLSHSKEKTGKGPYLPISSVTSHSFPTDPVVSSVWSTSSPEEQRLLGHCLAAFQLWLSRGQRGDNFSHSVAGFAAKQCDLWDELSRSDQLCTAMDGHFPGTLRVLRAAQEKDELPEPWLTTLAPMEGRGGEGRRSKVTPFAVLMIRTCLLHGEMFLNAININLTWGAVGIFVEQEGRSFVLSSKKCILMKLLENWEFVLPEDWKESIFYFFFLLILQPSGPQP